MFTMAEIDGLHDRSGGAETLADYRRHSDRKTTYVEMSAGLAASGVEKWVADTAAMRKLGAWAQAAESVDVGEPEEPADRVHRRVSEAGISPHCPKPERLWST